eukprot:11781767-Prorocentrum_lima.AAC.1
MHAAASGSRPCTSWCAWRGCAEARAPERECEDTADLHVRSLRLRAETAARAEVGEQRWHSRQIP